MLSQTVHNLLAFAPAYRANAQSDATNQPTNADAIRREMESTSKNVQKKAVRETIENKSSNESKAKESSNEGETSKTTKMESEMSNMRSTESETKHLVPHKKAFSASRHNTRGRSNIKKARNKAAQKVWTRDRFEIVPHVRLQVQPLVVPSLKDVCVPK